MLASEEFISIVNRLNAAKDLDSILVDMKDDLLHLFDSVQVSIFAVDRETKELYSKVLIYDRMGEIRVPISDQSIAGFSARYRRTLNIVDAYDSAELRRYGPNLRFDSSWDQKNGFRTRAIIATPILFEEKYILGVLELINKRSGGAFSEQDVKYAQAVAKILGVAFYNQHRLARQGKGPTKFSYLMEQNLLSQHDLEKVLAEARQRNVPVESLLISKLRIPKEQVGKALSAFYKCPFVEFDPKIIIPPDLLSNQSINYLKKNLWLPLKRENGKIVILIDNPHDFNKVEDIRRILKGQEFTFCVSLREEILRFLEAARGEGHPAASIQSLIGELESEVEEQEDEPADTLDEQDSTIVKLANQIIIDAYQMGASDIHIEPYFGKSDTVIRFRTDGSCREYQRVPANYKRALVSRLKIMSSLDIAERRKPQDGKIKFHMPGRDIELRIATIPTTGGNEDVVMRILAASEPIPLQKMNMSERNLREFIAMISKPYGIVLVVGPTGSGKTTTLHSALGYINTPERKIWTAEDPVEITQYGLRQVQVQPKIGFTFAAAMRAFLRADPDVIMIGEMRDQETAGMGIEASLTGHLVFSTLHTNSAVETLTRLLDMGLDPFNFADALLGVLAQRLVKTLCKKCKEPYQASEEEYEEIMHAYGSETWEKLGVPYDENFLLYRGKGCDVCGQSGYKGRTGIHELLIGSKTTKALIQKHCTMAEIESLAIKEGMATLLQDGLLKALKGDTDVKQVKAVAIK
ncbi:MAG: GspE/PulE family protein [Candidatus Tectomicrobia bacterium]|nr:GspE/PulE family protein [Candidatus Tectomicrobia bacterium]